MGRVPAVARTCSLEKDHTHMFTETARRPALLTLMAFLMVSGGCKQHAGQPETETPGVHFDSPPQRVVCGSPAVTEIVYALGCGDRVVGVSDYCTYPPELETVTKIGGWINPSRERLLMLKPDLILSQGRHEALATFANEYGIAFRSVEPDSIEKIYDAVRSIADMLGAIPEGTALIASMRSELNALTRQTQTPRRVLLVFGRVPGSLAGLATVGPGTFLDELVSLAGGQNIYDDAKGAYPQVSKESLLVRRPEVILEVNPDMSEDQTQQLRQDWNTLPDVPAVQDERIVYLDADYILIPGPRIVKTARLFAEAIADKKKP